jgi:Protein of unknown function (DUF3060)
MKDDDPQKRIRDLERGLGDVTRTPQSTPPYSANRPYAGNAPYVADPTWGVDFRPPRRRSPFPWIIGLVALGFLVPTMVLLVTTFNASNKVKSVLSNIPGTAAPGGGFTAVPITDTSTAPSGAATAVPQGGELKVGGNSQTQTIACNDGKLTLEGYGSTYTVTGHCVSLTLNAIGYNNRVTVDSADTVESNGYNNMVTLHACNNCTLKLTSYGMVFNVTGHAASLTLSDAAYNDKVTVDSVDSVSIGFGNYSNVITYHSGAPKVSDSGYSNTIQKG